MSTALLDTKLFVPRPRRGLVPRPRLSDRLRTGTGAKLVLVSAPAGFGKTTLLVDWVAEVTKSPGTDVTAAWLSLDAGDNDPGVFWRYVIAALRTAVHGVGEPALGLLQEPQPTPVTQVLTTLLNELNAHGTECLLVLDDYHVIVSAAVHEGVQFLLDHLPPTLRLVIASRADPALSLPRLRARGDLLEVRASDLRFTSAEAAAYLNETMSLSLSASDVAALEDRTEGWIAALQLAALSISGRDDVASFIDGFAGDDRYVVDYLVEEVLSRQPRRIQEFLLQTSVLDQMSGPLCDAITGGDDGRSVLEWLDRGNLFLVPLDDRRQWYRYHHLFADVLRARLLDERPDDIASLHLRAAGWYEQQGQGPQAIRHAIEGNDLARAAGLTERELPALRRDRREAVLRRWLEELPDDVLRVRPVLCNALAGSRMSTGTFDGVEELLDETERWLTSAGAGTSDGMVVADQGEFERLPAEVAMHRAGLALVRGDVDGTIRHSQRVLEVAAKDDHLARGAASALRGLAAWTTGDLETAYTSYAASVVDFETIGHVADVLGCSIALAADQDDPHLRGTVDMHVASAALHRERGDLAAARTELAISDELGEIAALSQNAYRRRVVLAQVHEAEGDVDTALDLLHEAERHYNGDFLPDVRPVAALRAQVSARHGHLAEALDWVAQRSLTAQDELTYLHELEHVTLARVLVAQHAQDGDHSHLDDATDLLARLLVVAVDGGRTASVIDIRVVEALAHHAAGDVPRAEAALGEALRLAEPERFVRRFLDEGAPMATLLTTADARGSAYARRLVQGGGPQPSRRTGDPGPVRSGRGPDLVEPLSAREREVLRLLGTELNGPEIARELVVSLNTVRTHTKNLYMKLGVNNRRAALRRARELDLL